MFWVYLTVILIVIVMVAFVVLLIMRLVKIMGSQIRRNAMRQLGRYANLLDRKSKELKDIEDRLSEVSTCKLTYGRGVNQEEERKVTVVGLTSSGNHAPLNLPSQYKLLKKMIIQDPNPYLEKVCKEEAPFDVTERKRKTKEFLEKMDFDTIYEMLGETSEEQQKKMVLLYKETEELLQAYKEKSYDNSFDLQDFLFFVKELDREYDESISLETSEELDISVEDVKVTVLSELLEGIRIKRYGKVYDYAISRREIGL